MISAGMHEAAPASSGLFLRPRSARPLIIQCGIADLVGEIGNWDHEIHVALLKQCNSGPAVGPKVV